MKKLLNRFYDYSEEELNIFCNYFRHEVNRFNIKKLFLYDKETKNNINIILNEEIFPKIKEQILNSNISTYRQYRSKYFKGDYLTIDEVYSIFNYLYHLTLFHCLLIIGDEQYLSIDYFFNEYELKELFPEKEYEPILKTAIIKLNKYFEEHQDKLKLFKEIDLDKNGVLSSEEFMTILNSMDDLNLEDNQKYKLLTVADKNKDGKINSKEFLSFIKSARFLSDSNSINEMKSTFPNINKKIAIDNTKFIPRYLNDISIVEENLKINKNILKLKKDNGFLNAITILQEDILDNFFNFDCIEQDFNLADSEKSGKVNYLKFNSILKKRLFKLKDKNFELFVDLANKGFDKDIDYQLKNEKVIDYKNFLANLVNYNEQGSEPKIWENDEEKKSEEENKIKLGGTAIEESKVEKDENNELDEFLNAGKKNDKIEESKDKNGVEVLNDISKKEEINNNKINDFENIKKEENKDLPILNDIITDKKEENKDLPILNNIITDKKEENKDLPILNSIITDKKEEDKDLQLLNDIIMNKKEEKKSDSDDIVEIGEEKKSEFNKEEINLNKEESEDKEKVEDIKEENQDEKETEKEEIKNYAKSIILGNTLIEETHVDKEIE